MYVLQNSTTRSLHVVTIWTTLYHSQITYTTSMMTTICQYYISLENVLFLFLNILYHYQITWTLSTELPPIFKLTGGIKGWIKSRPHLAIQCDKKQKCFNKFMWRLTQVLCIDFRLLKCGTHSPIARLLLLLQCEIVGLVKFEFHISAFSINNGRNILNKQNKNKFCC